MDVGYHSRSDLMEIISHDFLIDGTDVDDCLSPSHWIRIAKECQMLITSRARGCLTCASDWQKISKAIRDAHKEARRIQSGETI